MLKSVRDSVRKSRSDLDFMRLDETSWRDINAESFDYALMEKLDNLAVFPYRGRWTDSGDWQAVKRQLSDDGINSDSANNFLIGNACQVGSESCLIWADDDAQVVVAVGLKDVTVVSMNDAVLVINSTKTQAVKEAVELVSMKNYRQASGHLREFRPWGSFEILEQTNQLQVRRVDIYPREKITLQRHHLRNESWIVTNGTGKIQIEREEYYISEGQCIGISAGQVHQISNPSNETLKLIEVITGTSLNEDDVERFSSI